jgi:hypothetical protein
VVARIARIVGVVVLGLVLLVAVAVGGLAWRLSNGPIDLDFLLPTIQQAITPGNPALRPVIGHVSVGWDRSAGSPALVLGQFKLVDQAGATTLAVPTMRLLLAPGPLLAASIEPSVIHISGLEIDVVRLDDGTFDIGLSQADADQGAAPAADEPKEPFRLEEAMHQLTRPSGSLASLRSLTIDDALVTLHDAGSGKSMAAKGGQLALERGPDRSVQGRLALRLANADGTDAPGTVTLSIAYTEDGGWSNVALDLDRVRPSAFAALAPDAGLQHLDFPVSGRLGLASGRQVSFWPVQLELTAAAAVIRWPGLLTEPLRLARLELAGEVDGEARSARIDKLLVATDASRLQVEGTIGDWGQPTDADLRWTLDRLDLAQLGALWPQNLGTDARAWVLAHVTAGRVSDGKVHLRLHDYVAGTPLPAGSLAGSVAFEGETIRLLDGLPPATAISGKASLDGGTADLTLASGRIGGVALGGARLQATRLDDPSAAKLEVQADANGPAQEVLGLVRQAPGDLLAGLPVDLSQATGSVRAELHATAPLRSLPGLADVDYRLLLRLDGAALPDAVASLDLAGASGDVTLTPRVIEGKGQGTLGGIPFRIQARQDQAAAGGGNRGLEAEATLSAADASRLGLAVPDGISGEVPITATAAFPPDGPPRIAIEADLARLAVTKGPLGWQKKAGEAGKLTAEVTVRPEVIDIRKIAADAPGLALQGSASIARPSLQLVGLSLAPLRLGPSEVSASVSRGAHGLAIRIGARELDLRDVDLGGGSGGGPRDLPDMQASIDIARLRLSDQPITDISGGFIHEGGRWADVHLFGKLATGGYASLTVDDSGRNLEASSDDAGALAVGVGLPAGRFDNGRLELKAALGQDQLNDANGKLTVRRFNIRQAPALARIISLMSMRGITAAFEGEGVPFELLEVPFRLADRRIEITRARLVGSQIGMTAEGRIDLAAERLDLRGTVVPAYTVNRILGNIPILGWLMRGTQAQGAFAATYTARGPISDPSISVNPLSALVPGVIRDLFTGVVPDSANGDGARPATSP